MNLGDAAVLAKLFGQFRKGAWTTDPKDPNYANHWKALPLQPGEEVQLVYPGTVVPTARRVPGLSNMVNVRVTPQNVYFDTPNVERIGPVASAAGMALDRSGLATPRVYGRDQVQMIPVANRVNILAPGLEARGRTDQYVGRPSDLSARDQLRNLGKLLRH
jgi:hypothetical protein